MGPSLQMGKMLYNGDFHTNKQRKFQNVSDLCDDSRLWALGNTCSYQSSLLANGFESSCWMTSGTNIHTTSCLPVQRGNSSLNTNASISKLQITDTHRKGVGNLTGTSESFCICLILMTAITYFMAP